MACGCSGAARVGLGGALVNRSVVYVTAPRDDLDNFDLAVTYQTELEARVAAPAGHITRAIVV